MSKILVHPAPTDVTDSLGVEIRVSDWVTISAWGHPVRLADVGREAQVLGFSPNHRVILDSTAYAPDIIARGRAVPASCVLVRRRDGHDGHEGNRPPSIGPCEWYALCDREADGTVAHPVLGDVPTCGRCAAKHDLTLQVAL